MHPGDPRTVVRERVLAVGAADEKEAADQAAILRWIDSGAPLFRVAKPATPPMHLCVYFALIDDQASSVLLVDHVKANLWLLPGGHVDPGEDPRRSVEREAFEELQITPKFHERLGGGQPLFLSVTRTRGEHSHTDVTLWWALWPGRVSPGRLQDFGGPGDVVLADPAEKNIWVVPAVRRGDHRPRLPAHLRQRAAPHAALPVHHCARAWPPAPGP